VRDSEIFKFNISITPEQDVSIDMLADLGMDYNNIQEELEEMPSVYAYWAAMYSEVKEQCAVLERRIKARRGALAKALVNKFTREQVRLTDKQLTAVIESDKVLNELEEKKERMNKQTGKLYYMIQAIQMKSDNLRSLAGFARQEMYTQK